MYTYLIYLHSLFRWLVLSTLIYSIFKAYRGYQSKRNFTKVDNLLRHWTATVAHIQLLLGCILYSQSLTIKYFWNNFDQAINNVDSLFFSVIHIALMVFAIILITVGSAISKRKVTDQEKFKTMYIWFSIALLIIFISIPWPFSPFANRPYYR